jgi:hypothetical protein
MSISYHPDAVSYHPGDLILTEGEIPDWIARSNLTIGPIFHVFDRVLSDDVLTLASYHLLQAPYNATPAPVTVEAL